MSVLKINDLVTDTSGKHHGIGCVSKVFKNQVQVNFGLYDSVKISPSKLVLVDTSLCKTVTLSEYQSRIMCVKTNDSLNDCIVGNEVRHFVGIGWTKQRVVTEDDLKVFPRVV